MNFDKRFMVKEIIKKVVLLVCCFPLMASYGQQAPAAQDSILWNLEQCINYARENNIQINSQRLTTESSQQDLQQSKSAVLPDLYGAASQSATHYNTTTQRTTATAVSGSYGVNSSWTLYQGGYLKNDIRQKALTVQSSNLSILESINDISLQIAQSYLNILVDKESLVYYRDLLTTSRAQLEQAKRQYQVGSIARKDVVQFEAQVAADQYSLTTAQNAERQDKLTLKQLLQLPVETRFDVVRPDSVNVLQAVTPLNDGLKNALQTRPEIENGKLGVEIAKLSVDKAQSGYKPTITAGASLGSSYLTGQDYNGFSQLNDNFNQQIGLSLSIPIFTKGVNKSNVARAKISVKQAELDYRNVQTQLGQSVERAYINVQNAQSQYLSAQEQLKYTQEVYRIATQELKLGAANLVDYYQQRNQYIQSLQNSIQAKYNAALATNIYEFYLGAPLNIK